MSEATYIYQQQWNKLLKDVQVISTNFLMATELQVFMLV